MRGPAATRKIAINYHGSRIAHSFCRWGLSRLHGFRSAVVDESMLSHNSGL